MALLLVSVASLSTIVGELDEDQLVGWALQVYPWNSRTTRSCDVVRQMQIDCVMEVGAYATAGGTGNPAQKNIPTISPQRSAAGDLESTPNGVRLLKAGQAW